MEALSTLKVLYAEDEEAMAQQMQRAFGEDIALLRHAKNGLEAMEAFERENFDVVITDIQMPVVNGLELARRIKAKNPDFPIIITSAFNDEEYLIEAINIGVKRYLFKPVNLDLLQAYLLDIAQMAAIRQELTAQRSMLRPSSPKQTKTASSPMPTKPFAASPAMRSQN